MHETVLSVLVAEAATVHAADSAVEVGAVVVIAAVHPLWGRGRMTLGEPCVQKRPKVSRKCLFARDEWRKRRVASSFEER
jgi:hypothetical protein